MKNHILITLSLLLILFGSYFIYTKFSDNNDLEKIKLAEVTHSPFYAPLYVAIENNYFKEEGLDINLILTPGADKVSSALLSNDVQIGLCGPESNIYIYNGGEQDYLVTVAGLTKKDGQFIVSRVKNDNFKLTDLNNKEVLVGRHGGMPAINFINALGNNTNNVKLNYTVEYANLSSAFISGIGDYVNLFEPNATILENMGLGYIVGSVGELSGNVSYTTFNTRLSYYKKHQDELTKFNNALNKGLLYVNEHSSKDIANVISKQFPDISLNELTSIIENYKKVDTWYTNTSINVDDFKNLQTMMINNKLLDNYINSKTLIKDLNE